MYNGHCSSSSCNLMEGDTRGVRVYLTSVKIRHVVICNEGIHLAFKMSM